MQTLYGWWCVTNFDWNTITASVYLSSANRDDIFSLLCLSGRCKFGILATYFFRVFTGGWTTHWPWTTFQWLAANCNADKQIDILGVWMFFWCGFSLNSHESRRWTTDFWDFLDIIRLWGTLEDFFCEIRETLTDFAELRDFLKLFLSRKRCRSRKNIEKSSKSIWRHEDMSLIGESREVRQKNPLEVPQSLIKSEKSQNQLFTPQSAWIHSMWPPFCIALRHDINYQLETLWWIDSVFS